jgi:hypothetical protein
MAEVAAVRRFSAGSSEGSMVCGGESMKLGGGGGPKVLRWRRRGSAWEDTTTEKLTRSAPNIVTRSAYTVRCGYHATGKKNTRSACLVRYG